MAMRNLSVGIMTVLALGLVTPAPSAQAESVVNERLKHAVADSAPRLGTLEPWQQTLFDEEVLADYSRFVRDYRATGKGLNADIDLASIKNYLRFYGPKYLPQDHRKVLVAMITDSTCEKCTESAAELQALVKARLERRGLVPVFLSPKEAEALKLPALDSKQLDERVVELGSQKNVAGTVLIQWKPAPPDDEEGIHEDEKRYFVHSAIQIRGLGTNSGRLELLDNDNFEASARRLLTDAWTDLGSKTTALAVGSLGSADSSEMGAGTAAPMEPMLEVSGIRDFAQSARVKSELQGRLGESAVLEERKVSRGKVVFAVLTQKKLEEIRAAVGDSVADPASGGSLKVEVK